MDMVRVTSGLSQVGHATLTWPVTSFSKSDPHLGQWYS